MNKPLTLRFPNLPLAPRHTLRNLTLFLPYHAVYCARAAYTGYRWKRALRVALSRTEDSDALVPLLHCVFLGTVPPAPDPARAGYVRYFVTQVVQSRPLAAAESLLDRVYACDAPTPGWERCASITFTIYPVG